RVALPIWYRMLTMSCWLWPWLPLLQLDVPGGSLPFRHMSQSLTWRLAFCKAERKGTSAPSAQERWVC
ncbi:unnamed protein product, partial [Rangifer tarandus platyrhynchus]